MVNSNSVFTVREFDYECYNWPESWKALLGGLCDSINVCGMSLAGMPSETESISVKISSFNIRGDFSEGLDGVSEKYFCSGLI